MSTAEIIQLLIISVIATGGSIFLVIGVAGGVHVEPYIRRQASALLPALLLFGFAASTLISGRNASLYGLVGNILEDSGSGRGVWILRIATAMAVGISSLIVVSAFLRKPDEKNPARPLFFAFSIYFVFSYVVSGIFGTEPTISHKTFYPFLIMFGLYLTSDQGEELLLRLVRDGLLVMLITGLCLIPVAPDLVLQRGYVGFIPGFSYRYWGLASHANNIGPLSIFFFLILCWLPYRSRAMVMFAIAVAGITLIISQSKTSLVSATLIAGIFMVRWWWQAVFSNKFGRCVSAAVISLSMLAVLVVLVAFVADMYSQPMEKLLNKIQGRGTILTGREFIWKITVAEWERSPIFGYGPALWGEEFSARFGYLGIASNAHNQFFDTLGSAGIVGATSLIVYAAALVFYAVRLADPSNWLSIALIVFVLTRCISEVPLKTMNITTSDFFMHAVVIGLFMRSAWLLKQNCVPANQANTPARSPTQQ